MTTRIGGKGLEVPSWHGGTGYANSGAVPPALSVDVDKLFDRAKQGRYLLMPWPRKPQSRFEAEAMACAEMCNDEDAPLMTASMDEDLVTGTTFYRVCVLLDDVPTRGVGITLAEACANALWGGQ